MAEDRIRDLEFQFRRSNSVENEGELLVERVRVKDLDARILEIAGKIHYEAANACGYEGLPANGNFENLNSVVEGLLQINQEWAYRALLALVHAGMPRIRVLMMARNILRTTELAVLKQIRFGVFEEIMSVAYFGVGDIHPFDQAARYLFELLNPEYYAREGEPFLKHDKYGLFFLVVNLICGQFLNFGNSEQKALEAMYAVLREELVPVLLGYDDPLRRRVYGEGKSS